MSWRRLLLLGLCVPILVAGAVLTSRLRHRSARIAEPAAGRQIRPSSGRHRPSVQEEILRLRGEVAKNPKDAFLREQLSVLLWASGDTEAALSEITAAIRLAPGNPFYRYRLGTMHAEMGLASEALGDYLKAVELGRRAKDGKEWMPIYSYEAAKLLEQLKRTEEAEVRYEASLAQLSAYRQDWNITGMDRSDNTGRFGSMLQQHIERRLKQALSSLAKSRPSRDSVKKQLPFLCFPDESSEPGMGQKARDQLEHDLESGAMSGADLHIHLGTEYLRLGLAGKAVIELLAAIELEPSHAVAWHNLGWAYLMQGRLNRASQAFDKAESLGSEGSKQLAAKVEAARKRLGRE